MPLVESEGKLDKSPIPLGAEGASSASGIRVLLVLPTLLRPSVLGGATRWNLT